MHGIDSVGFLMSQEAFEQYQNNQWLNVKERRCCQRLDAETAVHDFEET